MPTCPTCHRWITRSELRAPKGAGPDVPRDRCPTDGTVLSLTVPLPPAPPRPKERRSARDVATLLLIAPVAYLLMAGAFLPWVALLVVGVALGLSWLSGHAAFALLGIAVAALMLAGGWVVRHYEA